MPGYMMHLSEGRIMERELIRSRWLKNETEAALFRDGLLLPDTRYKTEKYLTHFWNEKDKGKLALAPDLELFYARYKEQIFENPVLLGYWAHLHLDRTFVKDFWPSCFRFTDDEGNPQVMKEKITRVWLAEKKISIPVGEFYSGKWYYGDYSRMNGFLIDAYRITVPDVIRGCTKGIDHCDEARLLAVQDEVKILSGRTEKEQMDLMVFTPDGLVDFMEKTAAGFLQLLRERSKLILKDRNL